MKSLPDHYSQISLRSPLGQTFHIDAREPRIDLKTEASSGFFGQWMAYSPTSNCRLIDGISSGGTVDQVGPNLVFAVNIVDVGEAFVLLIHSIGYTVIRFIVSPAKCSIENFHLYLNELTKFFGGIENGTASVAAKIGTAGRSPQKFENEFSVTEALGKAASVLARVRVEAHSHKRSSGGYAGVDALATLKAWRTQPSWYQAQIRSANPGELQIGSHAITPLRTEMKLARAGNLFTAATIELLTELKVALGFLGEARIAQRIVSAMIEQLRQMDIPGEVDARSVFSVLTDTDLPAYSKELALRLLALKAQVEKPHLRRPKYLGRHLFTHPEPELVFQTFSALACLLVFDFAPNKIQQSLAEGLSVHNEDENIQAHLDTAHHGLAGWRDALILPSNYAPDLVLKKGAQKLLIDAKFRPPDGDLRLLNASSVKDMQAYLHEYGVSRAVVTYPAQGGKLLYEDLKGSKFWIRGIGLPPTLTLEIVEDLRAALDPMWCA